MKMNNIKIIDAIMGSGKTHNAIKKMKKHSGNFIYVTPFLEEVKRIIKNVPNVVEPQVSYDYDIIEEEYKAVYKRENLLRSVIKCQNLATTHSLFQKLHKNDYRFFSDYDLILDEVITPIKDLDMKLADIQIALGQDLIIVNDKTGEVTFIKDEYDGDKFYELKKYCETANVVYVNEKLLVSVFPPEIFKSFKSVTVLTYLFEGSLLASYFDYYNIKYKIEKASKKDELKEKAKIKSLLNVYIGKYNDIGNAKNAFSVNWLKNKSNKELKKISTQVKNLICRKFKTNSNETCFTTFKAYKSKLKGDGYANGFIPVNERATNKFSHKKTMIYFANRFLNPNVKRFFEDGNIKVNEDKWALAELVQWVFRGAIREGKPMNLFIPSKRMRTLFLEWLNET